MNRYTSIKLFSGKILIHGVRDSFIFAFAFVLFFWSVTLISDDLVFKSNLFTSGSDDLEYLNASVNSARDMVQGDFYEILERYFYFSLHSPGYPIVLHVLFKLTVATLLTGIFLNGFLLWVAVRLVTLFPKFYLTKPYHFLTVFALCPGLLITSLHLYKDLFLLVLVLISAVNFRNKNYALAIIFALLTHYFRPFNWVLLFISFVAVKKPKIIIYSLLPLGSIFLFKPEFMNFESIYTAIQTAQLVAVQDMQSYGSTYEPTGNFILDYLIGLVRFILLPIPFSINWSNRPFIFSALDFAQSIIIFISLFMLVYRPRRAFESMKNNSIIFIYTFLHASIYSVIYFGNGDSRYRVYIYVCAAILIIDLSSRMFRKGLKSSIIPKDG